MARRSVNPRRPVKKRSLKKPRRSLKKSKSKKRHFGDTLTNGDTLFKVFSNFVSPKDLLKLTLFTERMSDNALKQIEPDPTTPLSIKENLQKFIIWLYRSRIDQFVEQITPSQIILLSEGKYTDQLRNKLLYNTDPPPTEISGLKENVELMFLKSIFARGLVQKIKAFIKSLTNNQLVLLIGGKFNLGNALFNSFLHTKYPTEKTIKELEEKLV